MDKDTRNAIQRATQAARRLLEEEYRQQLEGTFDILVDGTVAPEPGAHLSDAERVTREKLVAAVAHERAQGRRPAEAVAAYLREAAFTTLNRFVALRMLEARGLVNECVAKGDESRGFKEFGMLAPGLGELPDKGYRLFIESVYDEIGQEVGVLFDREDAASLLWPRRKALHDLVETLAAPELQRVWESDETIGWVYQYFNSDDDREAARYDVKGKPKAPGDSYELAIRNQFFTPRYVVEFLTDNTLGRLWYEMREGDTALAKLSFLVPSDAGASPRPKKDPRDIRVLDPACGSGHFLLYAFDLLLTIYEEAHADADSPASEATANPLRVDYPTVEALRRAVPALVLEHNLHGVDIDPRAAQIASLALWLRAQRAYADHGVPAAERTPIGRSQIVVAEPMPGNREQVEDFASSLSPPLLGELFRRMVGEMKLAGEMGPLLRIERTLEDSISEARRQFVAQLEKAQPELPGFDLGPRQGELDLRGITDEAFFEQAEGVLVRALDELAARAEGAERIRRRLFADDARSGVAFIDLLRRPFDVLVMNPPFGDASTRTKPVIDDTYENSKQDLFAVFVERAVELVPEGFVGVLSTEAGFFRRTLEAWRRNVLLARTSMSVMAHLGGHVLDGATVRTAAYAMRTPTQQVDSVFLRLQGQEDRLARLNDAIASLKAGSANGSVFRTPQSEFEKLPYAVFGYWCSPELRDAFVDLPKLEENLAHTRQGIATADDFRFLRLRWEVPPPSVQGDRWMPFAKGGQYSPYRDDIHLVVLWLHEGHEAKAWAGTKYNGSHWSRILKNVGLLGRPGLTYPRRTNKRFAPRALPAGCAFGDKGPAIVDVDGSNWSLLALLNSRPVSYLLSLGLGTAEAEGGAGANSYEVGLVQRLPVPTDAVTDDKLEALAKDAWRARADLDLRDDTTALFTSPVAPLALDGSIEEACRALSAHLRALADVYVRAQEDVDRRTVELYGFADSDWEDIQAQAGEVHVPEVPDAEDPDWLSEVSARLMHFLVGCVFGRWRPDRLRSSDDVLSEADPFGPMPVPPMLVRADAPSVLVDDRGHEADLVDAIAEQLRAAEIGEPGPLLEEAAKHLGIKRGGVRRWLAKSAFGDHIKRYSKSRRKAPIYWQLATPSSSYSIWLYYHQLTSDTLYRVVRDFAEPKLKHEEQRLASMAADAGEGGAKARKAQELQEAFVEELRSFREEFERVAPLFAPNLDDGVIINFAPLWRLLAHERSWQTKCRKVWDSLAAGDYDWAHLAMHLWPERVVPKCVEDRSLAIAHGLEAELWYEDDDGKWHPREVEQARIEELVAERTSAAVKSALDDLSSAPNPRGRGRR